MQADSGQSPQDASRAGGAAARWWHDPRVPLASGIVVALLLGFGAWQAYRASIADDRREMLEARAAEGFLAPPSSARSERVSLRSPRRITLGGRNAPERLEILIEARGDQFNLFRIAIVRDDGTAALHVDRLQRDSNGDLRIALNSTLLPAGRYAIRVEGFTWRGGTIPVGSIPMQVIATQ